MWLRLARFLLSPSRFTGTTYARFRLSTDAAAENPTGFAADGEVEDYLASDHVAREPALPSVGSSKIAHETGGGPTLSATWDTFGFSVASLGDLDGDGDRVTLAVGAQIRQ